jgi:hypothetical protein
MLLKSFLLIGFACRVLKAWHLYTQALSKGMGKGRANKVLKLTAAKVKYIIRAKTDNTSSKIIAAEMKVSIRTVNRVWSLMKSTIFRHQRMHSGRDCQMAVS